MKKTFIIIMIFIIFSLIVTFLKGIRLHFQEVIAFLTVIACIHTAFWLREKKII